MTAVAIFAYNRPNHLEYCLINISNFKMKPSNSIVMM